MRLLLLLLLPVQASAYEMIYECPGHEQMRDDFLEGLGDKLGPGCRAIWDTRADGAIPAGAPIGYAERFIENGKPKLRENATLKAAKFARDAEKAAQAATEAKEKADFKALKDKIRAKTATAAEVRDALNFLLKRLGE